VSDGAKGGFSTGIPILQNSHIPIPVLPPGVQIALVNIFDRLLGANYGDQRKSQQTERVTHNNSRSRINTRTYIGGWSVLDLIDKCTRFIWLPASHSRWQRAAF